MYGAERFAPPRPLAPRDAATAGGMDPEGTAVPEASLEPVLSIGKSSI